MNTVDSGGRAARRQVRARERRRDKHRQRRGNDRRVRCELRRREHEHALAFTRFDEAARDELVVGGLRGVLREAELLLERAHRRESRARGQCTALDVALHARDDVCGGRATIGDRNVQADVGSATHGRVIPPCAPPRRDSGQNAQGTGACYDFQVVKIVTTIVAALVMVAPRPLARG